MLSARLSDMPVLLDVARERMRRYLERDPGIVYAHMLEDTVWAALEPVEPVATPYMLMGELLHAAAEALLAPGREMCRSMPVDSEGVPAEVAERFIRGGRVTVCGTPDAVLPDGTPVELKTTRRRPRNGALPWRWRHRAEVYAWLAGKPALLVVLHLVEGEEYDYTVQSPSSGKMLRRINMWLRGRYPNATLTVFT